ncbi:MAG TPA: ISL3 family transposase [Ktedonosporobacter sp.]|nr:ISL3 family transposase [Ktedonosporobacter sp.]
MDSVEKDLLASVLHLPAGIAIDSAHPSACELVIRVACRQPSMACPECHQSSSRIHGRYQRTVADVPCAGRNVILALTVRKFVCGTPTCPRQIFTERLPGLVQSYARMTTRLAALVQTLGVVAGGELGTRLAERLGIAMTPTTLLRHLMHLCSPRAPAVKVLGVDDWSWKKGRRYGTILVDLQRHKIIDLLPDRKAETFAQWLREHPEVDIISRDRGTDYAAAARAAAPQALQIADRFHLVRNLADALELLLAQCRADLRRAEPDPLPEELPAPSARALPHPQTWRQQPPQQMERKYQAHQAEREDRFRQIMALRAQGMFFADIAKRVGMGERSVRKWVKQGGPPIHRRRRRRRSVFDSYAAYVLERWQAGVHDGKQLFEEIQAQGFTGSVRVVGRFLQTLRENRRPLTDLAPPSPAEQFSARKAIWLFIREQATLTTVEQAELTLIRQASQTAETAYGLVQDFLTMVRKRQGERLDSWIEAVQVSQIPELQRFVTGILKDKDAVLAGLTQVYSNGPVEAQVHKLKLVKRSMFGRAKLPLLRQRLLNAL